MPSIQVRNLSEEAYKRLAARAKADKRSLQQEATWLIESALGVGTYSPWLSERLHHPDWSIVDKIYEEMKKRYGKQSDSTPLIRQMRDER
jgi:hypothetical protein